MTGAALMLAGLLLRSPAARELALRPMLAAEAAEHHVPLRVLVAVARRESSFRWWARGDHGRAYGLFQVHRNALPGWWWTGEELLDTRTNTQVACRRLLLGHRRCGGGWSRAAANFNGMPCHADPYGLRVLVAAR